jgi:type IV pilus assembly protein PilO
MKVSLDELKRLDPKEIGSWPAPFQLGVLVLVTLITVVMGYFLVLDGQREVLEQGKSRELELKQAFLDKKAKAINLEAYKEQLDEIQRAFGALLKQLPSKTEMESLITEINQSGVGRGLQFELFRPAQNETKTTEFAERPVELRIIGNYHDLAAFASDVSRLSRIVTLGDMNITTAGGTGKLAAGALTMSAVAKTYRALDAEEAVEARRAQKQKKG